jgi:hypothetical protein
MAAAAREQTYDVPFFFPLSLPISHSPQPTSELTPQRGHRRAAAAATQVIILKWMVDRVILMSGSESKNKRVKKIILIAAIHAFLLSRKMLQLHIGACYRSIVRLASEGRHSRLVLRFLIVFIKNYELNVA